MKTLLLLLTATTLALSTSPARSESVRARWPNGKLRSQIDYRDGQYDGAYRTWYESGRPYELRHYRKGHEEGRQQAWTESGELYINYDVKNGRHYGLVNATPCVPYYESKNFDPQWSPVEHRVGSFALTRQTGARVSQDDLDGKIHVASFIYTKCAAVCPVLVAQLLRVQRAFRSNPNVVLVSYTVTPETDSPAVLREFGLERHIDPARWWLVTGDRDQIYRLARQSYFADDDRSDTFLHTEKVLLVDADRRLRGVYNGTQPHQIDQLIEDITALSPRT